MTSTHSSPVVSGVGGIDAAALMRLSETVNTIVAAQPVTDMHTHVFAPSFGASPSPTGLLLWGIDELVTYHYLVAEVFRVVPPRELPYEAFWKLSKSERADHIWKNLFADRTPISEACRGVVTTLSRLGLDPHEKTLNGYRKWFSEQSADGFVDRVMELANVDRITMTNEFFTDHERGLWLNDASIADDPRFDAVLRVDQLISSWPAAAKLISSLGYSVSASLSSTAVDEAKRWLNDWIDKMNPVYVAMSLDPAFRYPAHDLEGEQDPSETVLEKILLPVLEQRDLPLALMIGSRRGVNPSLREAADIGLRADVTAVANLCAGFPNNRFMITMLARENQHELAVVARKFGNLLIFGCWWFLNNPSLIEEMTRMRLELLGATFVPQHSDARILDQLIYKWDHSRRIIAKVLTDKYADLAIAGYQVTEAQIRQDVSLLLRDNYRKFIAR